MGQELKAPVNTLFATQLANIRQMRDFVASYLARTPVNLLHFSCERIFSLFLAVLRSQTELWKHSESKINFLKRYRKYHLSVRSGKLTLGTIGYKGLSGEWQIDKISTQ